MLSHHQIWSHMNRLCGAAEVKVFSHNLFPLHCGILSGLLRHHLSSRHAESQLHWDPQLIRELIFKSSSQTIESRESLVLTKK